MERKLVDFVALVVEGHRDAVNRGSMSIDLAPAQFVVRSWGDGCSNVSLQRRACCGSGVTEGGGHDSRRFGEGEWSGISFRQDCSRNPLRRAQNPISL